MRIVCYIVDHLDVLCLATGNDACGFEEKFKVRKQGRRSCHTINISTVAQCFAACS